MLCIFIKPNVWYSWSLKILAIKRWFPFNFAKNLDLDDIKWNYSTSNFNNNWPLYFNFSNILNLCPSIWLIKNLNCMQFLFWKKSFQKTQIFHFLKYRYFVMAININVGLFWETSVGFLKSAVLQLFPKYSQSYVNLNVKSRPKFNFP